MRRRSEKEIQFSVIITSDKADKNHIPLLPLEAVGVFIAIFPFNRRKTFLFSHSDAATTHELYGEITAKIQFSSSTRFSPILFTYASRLSTPSPSSGLTLPPVADTYFSEKSARRVKPFHRRIKIKDSPALHLFRPPADVRREPIGRKPHNGLVHSVLHSQQFYRRPAFINNRLHQRPRQSGTFRLHRLHRGRQLAMVAGKNSTRSALRMAIQHAASRACPASSIYKVVNLRPFSTALSLPTSGRSHHAGTLKNLHGYSPQAPPPYGEDCADGWTTPRRQRDIRLLQADTSRIALRTPHSSG